MTGTSFAGKASAASAASGASGAPLLLTGAGDDQRMGDATYVRQRLTAASARRLLDLTAEMRALLRRQSDVTEMVVRGKDDDAVEFVFDGDFHEGLGPYGALTERVRDGDTVVVGETDDAERAVASAHVHGRVTLYVRSHSVYWTLSAFQNELWSHEVHQGSLLLANCIVCPESELPTAFEELAAYYPEQASEWLAAGRISAHDGSSSRALPRLSRARLSSLLEHEDPSVRKNAILGLSHLDTESPAAARGRSRG